MTQNENGFTVIEVMIAVVVLSIGLLGLAFSAALTTRMIAQGQRYTEAQALATNRFEILRSQGCPAVGSGSETTTHNFVVSWRIVDLTSGSGRRAFVTVQSPTGSGTRSDEFATTINCAT